MLSVIFICLSVTISFIGSEGGVARTREEDLKAPWRRKTERCCEPALLSHHPPLCRFRFFSRHVFVNLSFRFFFLLPSLAFSFYPSFRPERHLSLGIFLSWPPLQHISVSLNSWGYNSTSSIHQALLALINKHFESTPQPCAQLQMSPFCLCQYLSPCWRSYIRLKGRWLLQ